MAQQRPRAIGELLTELMARQGFARVQAASQCEAAWREAAGEMLAGQSRLGAARRGTLEVIVANSTLAQEIGFQKRELVTRLAHLLPDEGIKDLRVRVGRID